MSHRAVSLCLLAVLGALALPGCAPSRRSAPQSPQPRNPFWSTPAAKPSPQTQAHAHYATAVSLEVSGDPAAALDEFALAAIQDLDDEDLVLEVTGRCLQQSQPERALQILTNALDQADASGALYARLGFVYAQLGRTDLAIPVNQTATTKAPTLLAAHQNLYLNYVQRNEDNLALKTLDAAAQVPDTDAGFLIGLAELYANLGLQSPAQRSNVNARALALLRRAEQQSPTSPQLRLKLADGYNLLGDSARAAELYLAVLDDIQNQPLLREVVRSKLTDFYLRSRDPKRAQEQLEAILRDDPTHAQANFALGRIAFEEQRMEQAADHLARAVLLSPGFAPAYYDLAAAQLNLDRPADALQTLAAAQGRFPQSFTLEYLSGLARVRQQDHAHAVRHFIAAEVVARTTEPHRLTHIFYFEFGAALERSGDFATAVQNLEKCLELAPNFAPAQNYLGYMWAERGVNLHRAHDLIVKAVQAHPDNAAYLDSLGWVLFKLGRPREALDPMRRAVQAEAKPDPTVYDHLGDIHAALGESDKAREAWRKSLELEANETIRRKLESPAAQPSPPAATPPSS